MPIVRPLGKEEFPAFIDLSAYSFAVSRTDLEQAWQPQLDKIFALGVFDGEQMLAALRINPYQAWLGGRKVPLGGIAMVATPPEQRRRGHVDRLLQAALAQMRDAGQILSALQPFEFAFYRRYGWGLALEKVVYELHPAGLARYRAAGGVARRVGVEAWAQVAAAYDAAARERFGWFDRDEARWRYILEHPIARWRPRCALWSPEPDAPAEGYMFYSLEEHKWPVQEHKIDVHEWIAATPRARHGLLAFMANHDSQAGRLSLRCPPADPFLAWLDDPKVKTERTPLKMLRLVDVPAALAARPWAQGAAGELVVAIADRYAPWNQGQWRLSWEQGRFGCEAAPRAAADLSGDIAVWSQLYAGYITPRTAAAMGQLTVADPAALCLLQAALAVDEPFFFWEAF